MADVPKQSSQGPTAPSRAHRPAPPPSASSTLTREQQQFSAPSVNIPSSSVNQRTETRVSSARTVTYQRQNSSETVTSNPVLNYSTASTATATYDKSSIVSSAVPSIITEPSTKSVSSSSLSTMGESITAKELPNRGVMGFQEELYQAFGGEVEQLVPRATVQLWCPHTDSMKTGTLIMSNYRLVFRGQNQGDSFEVPLASIMSIEKVREFRQW